MVAPTVELSAVLKVAERAAWSADSLGAKTAGWRVLTMAGG